MDGGTALATAPSSCALILLSKSHRKQNSLLQLSVVYTQRFHSSIPPLRLMGNCDSELQPFEGHYRKSNSLLSQYDGQKSNQIYSLQMGIEELKL